MILTDGIVLDQLYVSEQFTAPHYKGFTGV